MTAPEPVAGRHRAEAWRVGNVHGERFGWSCLDCTSGDDGAADATAAERGAEWHALHPHGLTAPGPVRGATHDPRVAELLDILEGFCDEDRIRFVILERLDRADAAAGIRRVTLAEAIERASKLDFDNARTMRYGLGPKWEDAPEERRQAAWNRVRDVAAAALGGPS